MEPANRAKGGEGVYIGLTQN
uniref:Uncharacterized protein n=1 Tax=Arundo donax TaxID=35708 RepID=A0A0A8XQZ5_ARUDO